MKKFILPILSLLLLAACGNKTESTASETDSAVVAADAATSLTKEDAKAFVEAVYKTYLNPSEEDESKIDDAEITVFGMAYMSQYMSDNLQEKIVEANDKQVADDEIFFDYDIWTNAQDNSGMTLKEVNSVELAGETATLEVVLTNGSDETKVYPIIEYNKEKGCWFVSDFLVSGKKYLGIIEDYLNGED